MTGPCPSCGAQVEFIELAGGAKFFGCADCCPVSSVPSRQAVMVVDRREPKIPPGLLQELELAMAERDGALDALDALERILARIGGWLPAPDQDALRHARALLEEAGRRVRPNLKQWEDRK